MKLVVRGLDVFRTDIYGVRVKFAEDLRNGVFHKVVHVYTVHILVVDDVEKVVQAVAARIDDVQAVA